MERARSWDKVEAKEKDKITRIAAEAGGISNTEVVERVRAWADA